MASSARPAWSRRGVLAAACALPFAATAATAARKPWTFSVSVNLQGLEGSPVLPGRAGTDYFVATPADLAYLKPRVDGPCRLPFKWERLQPEPGGPLSPLYLSEIRSVADAAAGLGLSVILDCHNFMHRLVGDRDATVDGKDGLLTRQHLADLWSRTATAFAGHPGVEGWDLMNEPQGLVDGQDLAAIMQASVDAIDAVETRKTIYIEGDGYSSAERWVDSNPRYPLIDRHDRLVYSAHCYPDADGSGTHYDYAALTAHRLGDTVLVDRTRGFARWCGQHKLRGHIGETNVGVDDPRWGDVLKAGLTFWREQGLPVDIWLFAANFGPNPYNLFPVAGREAPQWAVIQPFVAT